MSMLLHMMFKIFYIAVTKKNGQYLLMNSLLFFLLLLEMKKKVGSLRSCSGDEGVCSQPGFGIGTVDIFI